MGGGGGGGVCKDFNMVNWKLWGEGRAGGGAESFLSKGVYVCECVCVCVCVWRGMMEFFFYHKGGGRESYSLFKIWREG